jgi:iron(III) transport system substrate-binding protein
LLFRDARAQAITTAITGHIAGADRTAKLIAGAKKEGSVTVYCSMTPETLTAVTSAFEKKYGIKVNLWRGTAGDILQRLGTEARGGRYTVDVVEGAAADTAPLARTGLLQEVDSPIFADLAPGSVERGRPWVRSRLSIFVAAYNTNAVKLGQMPKTYDDLLTMKWNGSIGIEAGDANWLMSLSDALGEARAVKLLRDIAARRGFNPRIGHTLMANLIASGEVPFAITIYTEAVGRLKRSGAPIEMLYLSPVIAMDNCAGVLKRAPHPYAAVLFLDHLLSDGQKYMAGDFYPVTNRKYQRTDNDGVQLSMLNLPKYLDENAKWNRLYKEIVTPRGR